MIRFPYCKWSHNTSAPVSVNLYNSISRAVHSMWPKHPSFSSLLFPNLNGQKLKLEIGGRLLIAFHLNQSNYLANHKQEKSINMIWLCLLLDCFQGCSKPLKALHLFRVIAIFQWIRWFDSFVPHPRIPVQGDILSADGDALSVVRLVVTPIK
jgi:hypothetical protein